MWKPLPGSIVALSVHVIALAGSIAFVERGGAAQLLSGATLQQNIPGARINLDTPLGSVVPISYGIDGSLEGRAGAIAFYLGSGKDRGRWWIEGSRLCHQWNVWFNGRRKCFSIHLKADNRVQWTDQDGDTGTGTIVALGNGPRTPPKSSESLVTKAPEPALESPAHTPTPTSAPPRGDAVPVPQPTLVRDSRRDVAKSESPAPKAEPQQASSVSRARNVQTFRVVNVAPDDVLNIRRGPGASTEIVAAILPRTTGVLATGNCVEDWCPVRSGQGVGWVNRYFLMPEHGVQRFHQIKDSRLAITYRVVGVPPADVLNVRRIADGDSEIVATIPSNAGRLRISGYCSREWCPVAYGGNVGWVNRQFLALEF